MFIYPHAFAVSPDETYVVFSGLSVTGDTTIIKLDAQTGNILFGCEDVS